MRVSVLGIGLMGAPIAVRLRAQGHDVIAWNRTPGRAESLGEQDVQTAEGLTEAVAHAELLLLTLSDAAAMESVLFGADRPLALEDRCIIQMGTIGPDQSRALARRVARVGGSYLEAPVLGSIPEAKAGSLIVMAGGDAEHYARCLPVLQALGRQPRLIGSVGHAAALKLALNQLIASLTTGFAASLALVRAEGVDVDLFMELLRGSALYAPTYDKKLQRMLDGDFANPNFPLRHLLKDVRLFRDAAQSDDIDDGVIQAIQRLLERGMAEGLGSEDYSALFQAVSRAG